MGYKSPYNKVGKVMPEMKNQSKSSLMMNDASPLYETDPKTKRQEYMENRESERVEKARKADAIKERVQNRRMEQTIARDKAINERRAAVIERRKQKDPSYEYKKEGTATGQQHFQSSVTPLEMRGSGGSHPELKIALERAKAKAAQLQTQKTSDSLNYAKKVEKQFRSERGQLNAAGDRQLMEDVKKRASEDYDFDIIQPTEQFPQTGVSVKKGAYLGGGYVTASGKEAGFGDGMSVSRLAKDKPRSGFEQTKAKNISKLLGLK